jgi:hypothetical protein
LFNYEFIIFINVILLFELMCVPLAQAGQIKKRKIHGRSSNLVWGVI